MRAGTLPLSSRIRSLFPTAYESPRVRFTLVDGKTKQKMPGWVVREHGYVYGLLEWYKANDLIPGSLVNIRRGETPGEVIIEPQHYRAKDWVRTVIVGADGDGVIELFAEQDSPPEAVPNILQILNITLMLEQAIDEQETEEFDWDLDDPQE